MVGNPANGGEGGYVELRVGVVLPDMKEATRTMSAPAIERLHLLVFDDNGLLSEAVPAELDTAQNTEWGETSAPTYFKVKLARTDYKRTIHFVANSPIANVADYPMSTEGNILTSLVVSGQQDAYWQRVVLPNGITGTQGKDANGNIIYVPTDDVKAALTNVPLVRNHSRVKVVNAIPNDGISKQLTGLEFVLVNIPASGTVVPFNNNSGEFVNFTDETNYAALDALNYDGFEPANRNLINNTFNGGDLVFDNEGEDWVNAGGYQYLYERNQKLQPAYVIVRGTYANDPNPTYYKIDIINDEGVSYNLLRNIQYTVNITNVLGSGFDTAEKAYKAGPTNNLNFSVETKNLLNLSDGTSALYVEYTQKVINNTGATVTLRYRYVTNLSTSANNTDAVVITKGEGEVISGDIADGDGTTDGDGWNTMSFTAGTIPAEGESAKTQIVTLTAGSFARNVEFFLTRPYTLRLDVPDMVGDKLGSSVISSLILEERLPMGIFPLEFVVVAENNSLSPDATLNTLPVVTGVNVDGTPGGQHFGYKVTYEWDQYYTVSSGGVESYNTTIPLYFKTNMAQSSPLYTEKSTVEGIDCYAYNQYHSIANDEYWIHKLYGLSLSVSNFTESTATTSFQLNTSNQTVTWPDSGYFDFDILSDHTLTGVTDRNGDAVSGASIVNSGKTLRITQDAYNAARNYTLTFSAPNITGTTMTISNAEFGMASATVQKPKITWQFRGLGSSSSGYNYMSNGTDYTLRISLPENVTAEQLTGMKINVESYRTTVRIAGSNISDGNSYSLTITDTNVTNGYVDVTIRATRDNTYTGATFSLTLTGPDGVDMPASFNFQIRTDNNGRYQLLN